jgi:hypothetical protein
MVVSGLSLDIRLDRLPDTGILCDYGRFSMKVVIPKATYVSEGVWQAHIAHDDLKALGEAFKIHGRVCVLSVREPKFSSAIEELEFERATTSVLNLGSTDICYLIDVFGPGGQVAASGNSTEPELTPGDQVFLREVDASCPELTYLTKGLLAAVRAASGGELRKSATKTRYVNHPDNFWTIQLQPRKRNLRITIRGNPYEYRATGHIVLRRDMAGYSFFTLSRPEELDDAIDVLLQALARPRRRR